MAVTEIKHSSIFGSFSMYRLEAFMKVKYPRYVALMGGAVATFPMFTIYKLRKNI